jgi:hypothetical protein
MAVLEVSEANIAAMTKEASDISTIMTVIDMEISLAARIGRSADCALPILRREHFVVRPNRDAVSALQLMIFRKARVIFAPLARVSGRSFRVAIFGLAFVGTLAAYLRETVVRCFVAVELIQRFVLLAPAAPLHAFRRFLAWRPSEVGLLPRDLARFAVGVQSISFRPVLVKLGRRFGFAAGFAGLFHDFSSKRFGMISQSAAI